MATQNMSRLFAAFLLLCVNLYAVHAVVLPAVGEIQDERLFTRRMYVIKTGTKTLKDRC
jgi:hypothetical protein